MLPWAHPNPHPKRHLDRFSRFCAAHGRTAESSFAIVYNGLHLSPENWDMDPRLIHVSLGPSHSAFQTASRSVKLFCTAHSSVPTIYNGPPLPHTSKLPHRMGDLDPHLIYGSLAHLSPQPKRHLDRFIPFCRAHDRDRQTDRPRYIGNCRTHLPT